MHSGVHSRCGILSVTRVTRVMAFICPVCSLRTDSSRCLSRHMTEWVARCNRTAAPTPPAGDAGGCLSFAASIRMTMQGWPSSCKRRVTRAGLHQPRNGRRSAPPRRPHSAGSTAVHHCLRWLRYRLRTWVTSEAPLTASAARLGVRLAPSGFMRDLRSRCTVAEMPAPSQPAGDHQLLTARVRTRVGAQGTSLRDAPDMIAEEQLDTHGSINDLELDARQGLPGPRQRVTALARELNMEFEEKVLTVAVDGVPPIKVPVQVRSLRGAARWHFRYMTTAHCAPRTHVGPSGERQYAEPMSCDWAHTEHSKVVALDPDGVMLPLAIASDGTDLCPELSTEPVYVINNALPLHERERRPASSEPRPLP